MRTWKRARKQVLEREDIAGVRALELSPLERALFEWTYTSGARASEPGLAKLADVDLRSGRVQLVHLKHGQAMEWAPLAPSCARALEAWIPARQPAQPQQREYLFPSARPGRCYPCRGTGKLANKRRGREPTIDPCHHCEGGMRWGLSRHEVARILRPMLLKAGVPESHAFPHVLRHSAVSHLLDSGAPPTAIQERVGHRDLATTMGYMRTTKAARELVAKAFEDDDVKPAR